MLHRQTTRIVADPRRVLARPFVPADPSRIRRIAGRVLALPEAEALDVLAGVMTQFAHRHRNFEPLLRAHAALALAHIPLERPISDARRLLLGAYFTHEYSIEAAALFNPSIVLHPEQAGVGAGEARVLLSFRATGEGHISSVEFREGTLSPEGTLHVEAPSPFAMLPRMQAADELVFPHDSALSERVIFPITADESNGIEDVRWVRLDEPDGSPRYLGTYTAYDGKHIQPKLLETADFVTFRQLPLKGAAVRNKGFALFPRRVGGRYAMLGRQDNENNFVMFSESVDVWEEATLLRGPATPHEFVQIGNNGSPIETTAGWLVLTHGVGPMRQYTLGADLLALDDPTRLIARLEQPLLAPNEMEREGYVPNVVYTCGALLHNGLLVIPYAMSDAACGVATVPLEALLRKMGVSE